MRGLIAHVRARVRVRAHMLRTMTRMTNAFIMGKREAVMAENILVSSFTCARG